MTKRKSKSKRTKKKKMGRAAARKAVAAFVSSPGIIMRSVTVDEAVAAFTRRKALWPHQVGR